MVYYCAICAVVPWAEAAAKSWCALYVWVMHRPRAAQVQPLGGVSGGAQSEGMSRGCFALHFHPCPFPLLPVVRVCACCNSFMPLGFLEGGDEHVDSGHHISDLFRQN